MTACGQRKVLVQKALGIVDDLLTAHWVVLCARSRAVLVADRVRTVQGVVQAAPAGIGSVQCKTRVHDRYDQLGTGNAGHFIVDIFCADLHGFWLGQQIANALQKGFVRLGIVRLTLTGFMPFINLLLNHFALFYQRLVDRR